MKIHPSACIAANARIDEDVEIGPRVIIGEHVEIGAGCVLQAHVVMEPGTRVGENNFLGVGSILGTSPQDLAFEASIRSRVQVGSGNIFREYVTVHRGTREGSVTSIGNNNRFFSGSHVGHNVQIANRVTLSNNCLLGGYVEVGEGATLGADSVFHQHVRVGAFADVQGGIRCTKDLPPYVLMTGTNHVGAFNREGLHQAGWTGEQITELQCAFALVYRDGLNVTQALDLAKGLSWSAEANAFFTFIASSRRGICGGLRRKFQVP